MIRRIWFWEQAVLCLLLGWALAAQGLEHRARGTLGPRMAVLIVASSLLVLAAQKVRSMADRQRETNEAAGVEHAPMDCSSKVAGWATVLQGLSLFVGMASAPTEAHVAIAVYVALYPFWRRAYRARYPLVRFVPFPKREMYVSRDTAVAWREQPRCRSEIETDRPEDDRFP